MGFNRLNNLLETVLLDQINESNNPKGFYLGQTWNSICWIDGKPYRERVEVLIIKGDSIFLRRYKNEVDEYRTPGGGTEPTLSLIDTGIKECAEEAKLKVKDVINVQVSHIELYDKENLNEKQELLKKSFDFVYEGVINRVLVGTYDGEFEGYVEDEDLDQDMDKHGRFYKLESIKSILLPQHINALEVLEIL